MIYDARKSYSQSKIANRYRLSDQLQIVDNVVDEVDHTEIKQAKATHRAKKVLKKAGVDPANIRVGKRIRKKTIRLIEE